MTKPDAFETDGLETSRISRSVSVFLVVVAAFSAYISFHYALKIKFGPIDDHEVFKFLGSKQQIGWLDIPNVLWTKTEVGKWGTSPRYRPSYYAVRIFETKFFGANPTLWYALRLVLVAIVSFLLTSVALQLANLRQKSLTAVCGVISILSVLTLNAWTEIILRLGPAEFYLGVGYAFFLYLLIINIQKPRPTTFVALTLSLVIVAGSKENGVSLLLPFLLLTAYLVQKKAFSKLLASGLSLVAMVFSALVFLGPLNSIDTTGADIYGNQRSLKGSMILGLNYIKSSDFQRIFSLLLLILLCSLLQRKLHGHNMTIQNVAPLMGAYFVLQIVLEHIFYMGNFSEPRYTLITEISKTLLLLIAIFSTVGLVIDVLGTRHVQARLASLALLLLAFPATYTNFKTSATGNQKTALSKAESTSAYQQKIRDIVQALGNRSSENVVIQMNNIWDYEPAYAVIQYLQYYGRGANFFLNLQIPPVPPGLETTLLAQLSDFQLNGSKDWNVKPKPVELGNNNFCIVFNGAAAVPNVCEASYGA